ncbi:hypothetical protein AB0H36_41720 [Kribbella sp. NPDC050820]|uniref:hypothetical protein n=1 Tax=Kribbella sp. NPDC050820 TaxID=3155408 RepID=UPI0033F418A0
MRAAESRVGRGKWWACYATALGVAIAGYIVAYFFLLPDCARTKSGCSASESFHVVANSSPFAALAVLALAVERFLEPWSRFIGPNTGKRQDERDAEAERASSSASTPARSEDADDPVRKLARKQAAVDQGREMNKIIFWGIAVGLSFLLAGVLNVLLIRAIAPSGADYPSAWADLLITGLVIGVGAKPLHDLVAQIEKSKESKKDLVETGGQR